MKKQIKIQIEPELLKYARKYSGYTLEQAASKSKIKAELLESYESVASELSVAQIEKLSNVYKRPLAFFFLKQVPDDTVLPKDFRIVYATEAKFSPKIFLAIRRARYIQSVIAELAEKDFNYSYPKFTLDSNPESAAEWFRQFLNIEYKKQIGWSNPSIALKEWKAALEAKGVFVLQQSLPKANVSAFCLIDRKPYIILLNSIEHEHRRIFSLFHEIGHIFLNISGICTPEELKENSYRYQQIEKFCNQFSASLILPKNAFIDNSIVQSLIRIGFANWQEDDFKKIANDFKCSKEVVLRRFLTLGYISENQYGLFRDKWLENSKLLNSRPKQAIKIPQYQKCLSQNGRGFTSLIINLYHNQRISFSTAADILNIGPKYVTQVEAHL